MDQSNLNSPRIDDNMADQDASFLKGAPVDSRAQERLRTEGAGPRAGTASADAQPEARQGGTSEGLTNEQVQLRAEMASCIEGAIFPCDGATVLASAQGQNAPQAVIKALKGMSQTQTFETFEQVWEACNTNG